MYRSDTVNSKLFVGKALLLIEWKFKLKKKQQPVDLIEI